jgi:prepilin-type N-terminal cleavage/methylation domain-containing protein
MERRRLERGMTLIEVTIVLTVIGILTAASMPIASRTIERGRLSRALVDMQAISASLSQFLLDIPHRGPKAIGTAGGSADVDLLVSDGDIPEIGAGDANWDDPVGLFGPGLVTDFLDNHILQNEPFDTPVLDANAGPYAAGGWRGAYIQGPIDPDPWGNRYAVNTAWLEGTATERRNDTFVLSVGPNEVIDTAWQMDGAVSGDDDMIVIVRRDTNELVP